MRVNVVTHPGALAPLWPEWHALWARVPDAVPFLSPAWLCPWWECFGNARPVVVTARDTALRAVLPIYVQPEKLLPFGVGISDYFDALIDPASPPGVAARLLEAALAASPVARCDLPELPAGTHLRELAAPPGWQRATWHGPPCPTLALQPAPAIPAGMRRDVRQARNRAARAGGFAVRRADAVSLTADLHTLFALHAARWNGRGEPGVLADATVRRFHETAAPQLLQAGLLRLEILTLADAPAAALYALLGTHAIHVYLSGFNAARAFESPGTILLAHMLEQAAAEGRHTAHFLRGGEAYKYAWGARQHANLGVSFTRA